MSTRSTSTPGPASPGRFPRSSRASATSSRPTFLTPRTPLRRPRVSLRVSIRAPRTPGSDTRSQPPAPPRCRGFLCARPQSSQPDSGDLRRSGPGYDRYPSDLASPLRPGFRPPLNWGFTTPVLSAISCLRGLWRGVSVSFRTPRSRGGTGAGTECLRRSGGGFIGGRSPPWPAERSEGTGLLGRTDGVVSGQVGSWPFFHPSDTMVVSGIAAKRRCVIRHGRVVADDDCEAGTRECAEGPHGTTESVCGGAHE